jgi:hypothetical protein
MSKDMNEDQIEATIRRIEAEKVARAAIEARSVAHAPADPGTPNAAEDEDPGAGESLIEKTIRRIEADKAQRAAHVAQDAVGDHNEVVTVEQPSAVALPDESFIEATIRRVESERSARDADEVDRAIAPFRNVSLGESELDPPTTPDVPTSSLPDLAPAHSGTGGDDGDPIATERVSAATPVDESLIEATLRRLEAERAAREEEQAAPTAPAPFRNASLDDTYVESPSVDVPSVEAWDSDPQLDLVPALASAAYDSSSAAEVPQVGALPHEPLREDADVTAAVARLERGLSDTNAELRALAMRVDALLPLLDRLAVDGAGPPPISISTSRIAQLPTTREWDDELPMPRIPVGSPPRPAIFRDPAPQTATARKFVEEPEVEDQSIAAAPPPAPVDGRRGFELLPRNYRITVEDKRRGVDLVPLHRALLGLDGVKDMSLLSYSNGVAIVALVATAEIHSDVLGEAVARAMARETKVEVHNEQTMVVKLAE